MKKRNYLLILILFIVLVSFGCKKNPMAPTSETTDPSSYLLQPNTYPSFFEYLAKYNKKVASYELPSSYIIPMSIKPTDQISNDFSTCMAHATAHALSITLQNRQPPFYFMGMQFDPNFIIDRAFLSLPGTNLYNFMKNYRLDRVIDVVSGQRKERPFAGNPGIESWGIDILGDYAQFDPVSVFIAQPYSTRSKDIAIEVYQYSEHASVDYDFAIKQFKKILSTNAAIVYVHKKHAITLIGWSDKATVTDGASTSTGAFIYLNSFGPSWGDKGRGLISYDTMKNNWQQDYLGKIYLESTFIFDIVFNTSEEVIEGFKSFFTEVNKELRNPFNSSQSFSVDTQKNINIGYYQGNDKATRFEIVDLENNVIKEIITDQSSIMIRKRYRDLKKKTAANILTVNRDDIAHLDTFKIIYYNDNKIADTITLQPQKINRITHINGVDVKTGTFVAKPDDTLLVAYTKSITGKAKFELGITFLGEVANGSAADGTISLKIPSTLSSGIYRLYYYIDDQIWDQIIITVEDNVSKIIGLSINGNPVSNIYSNPMVRMGDVIRVEIRQSNDGNGKVLLGDILIGETNVKGTYFYTHTMTSDLSEYISMMLADADEKRTTFAYNYQNTTVDSFTISPAFKYVDARPSPEYPDDMTKMLLVYNNPEGYFPDDYHILLWFDDALEFQNEIGTNFYGSRMNGDKFQFTSIALDGDFFNHGRLFGGIYTDIKKRSGKNIKFKNRDIIIGPSDVFLYINADSISKKDFLYLGVLSPGLIY